MAFDPDQHHRRSIRLAGYDYSQAGAYFVTVCTHERQCLFGDVVDGEVRLNPVGCIAARCWEDVPRHFQGVTLGAWVVMPNHVHAIIVIHSRGEASASLNSASGDTCAADASPLRPHGTRAGSVGAIVQNYKSVSARKVNSMRGTPGALTWQRNYWERVIRDEAELLRLTEYIRNNPRQWEVDRENPSR